MGGDSRLRILFISPEVPYPVNNGGAQRKFHFIRQIALRNRLTLLALTTSDDKLAHKPVFEEWCEEVHFVRADLNPWRPLWRRLADPVPDFVHHWDVPALREAVRELAQPGRFDLIQCVDIGMTKLLMDLPVDVPVVTDRTRVDLEYQMSRLKLGLASGNRLAEREALLKLRHFEKRVLRRFPHQVVCSPDDLEFLRRELGVTDNVCIVRNGIDDTYFRETERTQSRGEPVICFTGAMEYLPNADGLQWFFSDIFPLLRDKAGPFQTVLAGRGVTEEIRALERFPGVEVTGEVPDLRPYYSNCDVYIAPIRLGGGTRLKIVEAMALGRPVVSTRIGCQGLDFVDREHLLMADTPEEFARAIVELLRNPEEAAALAKRGQAFVLEHFTWTKLGAILDNFYRQVAGK